MGSCTKTAVAVLLLAFSVWAKQDAAPAKPTEQVIGSIVSTDPANHTITVKDDKTGTQSVISVGKTRTIFRVPPDAKDLKNAVRITADDLQAGDRIDVRGFKSDGPASIEARSVVLMSARDLEQKRAQEQQAWQNATVGSVSAVDPNAGTLTIKAHTAEGPKEMTVQTSKDTAFTRYSPDSPAPVHSQLADIQPGDQVHIIGTPAEKIYSAPVRTVAGTVISIAPDGKQLTVRNLQTKQPVTVSLADGAQVKKLPPMVAMMLARRFNPSYRPPQGGGNAPRAGPPQGGAPGAGSGQPHGDLNHLIQRIPDMPVTDLKPGDALVIWGLSGGQPDNLTGQTILAGVEPVLQSAPPRQGQSLSANWDLSEPISQ